MEANFTNALSTVHDIIEGSVIKLLSKASGQSAPRGADQIIKFQKYKRVGRLYKIIADLFLVQATLEQAPPESATEPATNLHIRTALTYL